MLFSFCGIAFCPSQNCVIIFLVFLGPARFNNDKPLRASQLHDEKGIHEKPVFGAGARYGAGVFGPHILNFQVTQHFE